MGNAGWAESILGTGIRKDHRLACQSSHDRKRGRRCDCPYSWWARTSDGKRVRVHFTGTLVEAKAEKQRLEVEYREAKAWNENAPVSPIMHEWTLRVFQAKARTVKPMTMNSYDRAYRERIHPTFGTHEITEITPMMVGDWLNAMIDRDGNTDKVYKAYQVLRLVLNEAFRQQVIAANPVFAIKYPKKSMKPALRSRDRVLSNDQYQALLDACKTPRQRLLIRLATEAGLRSGELCGLRFSDLIPGAQPFLHIQRNITEGLGR